jgi:HAD superfamily hydrolase (TIGR01509 family)
MLKAIIFDFDGLLTDSNPLHAEANQQFLTKYGKIHSSSKGKREGLRIIDCIREYKDIYNLSPDISQLYAERQAIFYKLVKEKLELFSGAMPLLEKIKIKKIKIILATSGDKGYINLVFDKFPEFARYFSLVVTGDDVVRGKPYPDIYEQVLKKISLAANECIVVEDSINGILSGKAAGIKVVAIPNIHYPEADYSIADKIFENLDQFNKSIVL